MPLPTTAEVLVRASANGAPLAFAMTPRCEQQDRREASGHGLDHDGDVGHSRGRPLTELLYAGTLDPGRGGAFVTLMELRFGMMRAGWSKLRYRRPLTV